MNIDRRYLIAGGGAVVLAAILGGGYYAFVRQPSVGPEVAGKQPALPTPATGGLPDQVLGDAKAPVTIIEYASMTCPHCATFHEQTFPELKKRYIDTGKVRFIFREFPLDDLAAAGFMLARCAAKDAGNSDKYYGMIDLLFSTQRTWAVNNPLPPLFNVVKQTGFTQESFDTCLANREMFTELRSARDVASQKEGVQSTPTFIINGKKLPGALTIDQIEREIQPYLKS